MKGIVVWAAVLGIALVTLIFVVIIPVAFLKVHIARNVFLQHKFSNVGASLLTLLSIEPNYEALSLHFADLRGSPDLRGDLNKIVDSQCYKMTSGGELIDNNEITGCQKEFELATVIVLPYNPGKIVQTIELMIK